MALNAAALSLAPEALALAGTSSPYPLLVLCTLAALLMATLVSLVARRRSLATAVELVLLSRGGAAKHLRFALVVAVWLAWVALVSSVGFIAATAAAVFASVSLAGVKGLGKIAFGSILFAVLLTVAVKTVLYVAVPEAVPEAYLERLLFRLRS
ncbi:hypothetical protein [Acuticoccus sp.]|uniref:hypothetical protein n=1 Tax=Acuticoccus sp. TaxID=1904378 RepID=UPI003B53033D